MSVVRVYLPARAADLDVLATERRIDVTGRIGYAVTPELIAATPRADQDEREHLAFAEAARAAFGLAGPDRSLVVAGDVAEADVRQVGDMTVELAGLLELRQVASFHLAEEPEDVDADLLWYDVTELASVRSLVATRDH